MPRSSISFRKSLLSCVTNLISSFILSFNSIVYKNGSTHTIEDYADMAIRTASKRAYLMGEGSRRAEWGIRKVVVNSRIGACPRCGQYVGKVFIDDVYSGGSKADGGELLLSEAIRGGLFHPRCKDSTSTYFEGITTLKPMTEEEMEEMDRREKEEARQAYHEREAEKNQRIADNSLDSDNKKAYAHRAEEHRKKAAQIAEKPVANSGESGIIKLKDSETDYSPVTQESIENVALLDIFSDDALNLAHRNACRELLREVMSHGDSPVGTEFSRVYDELLQPINKFGYRQGSVGTVKIDKPIISYHAFHNHASCQTFSISDIIVFSQNDKMLSVTAVGNNGKLFVLFKDSNYDKNGFVDYVLRKSSEPLLIIDDTVFSLESLTAESVIMKTLSQEQIYELKKAVVKKCVEIAKGGARYGVKYKTS